MLLNEMEIFYCVAELKSFSKAAHKLGVSKSFVSKKITQLEHALKAQLLFRSTRKLTLTEAGSNFQQYCTKIVKIAEQSYSAISELQGKPAGSLKISAPPALALYLLMPLLPKFMQQNPDVSLNIQLESHIVNLIEEGYDLALRSGKLVSSNLISQRVYTGKNLICASPAYLQRHGKPKTPADLKKHNFAIYSQTKSAQSIKITKDTQEITTDIQGNFISNHLDLIKKIALNHLYMAILPEFMVKKEIKNGELVACLTHYQLQKFHFYAIYPAKEFVAPKVKAFIKMIKDSWAV